MDIMKVIVVEKEWVIKKINGEIKIKLGRSGGIHVNGGNEGDDYGLGNANEYNKKGK